MVGRFVRRMGSRLLAMALAAVLVAGCSARDALGLYGSTRPMVKIGLIAPFEELYRDDGYASLHAVRLALAQRNAAGGAGGRNITLVALNDDGRPEEAAAQAAKLGIDRDVLGVVGPIQEAGAAAAAPVLAGQGLPWIAPVPLTSRERPGGFALAAPPETFAAEAVSTLATLGVSGPVAVFAGQEEALAGAQQAAVESGLAMTSHPLTAVSTVDLSEAGAVVWLGDAAEGAGLLRQWPAIAGGQVPLVGGPALGSPIFPLRAGDALQADVSWLSSGPSVAALPGSFVAAYRELAGSDPSPQAVLAYDATNLLLDAIARVGETSGPLDRQAVQRALADLGREGWQGLSGQVTWQGQTCGTSPCWQWQDAPVHRLTVGWR